MARILLIETSGPTLSVAIADGGKVLAERVCREPRMQASLTAPLVKEVLDQCSLAVSDCDAVCVSKGPGSYTGLRVGTSTAKGLCCGAGIPLFAISTLDVLAAMARDPRNKSEDDCYMYKIVDVRLKQSFWERIVKIGTIECYTGDVTDQKLTLLHIRNAKVIKDYIFKASEEARMKRRTVNMQNIGALHDLDGDGVMDDIT